jgi:hypothetical protein
MHFFAAGGAKSCNSGRFLGRKSGRGKPYMPKNDFSRCGRKGVPRRLQKGESGLLIPARIDPSANPNGMESLRPGLSRFREGLPWVTEFRSAPTLKGLNIEKDLLARRRGGRGEGRVWLFQNVTEGLCRLRGTGQAGFQRTAPSRQPCQRRVQPCWEPLYAAWTKPWFNPFTGKRLPFPHLASNRKNANSED